MIDLKQLQFISRTAQNCHYQTQDICQQRRRWERLLGRQWTAAHVQEHKPGLTILYLLRGQTWLRTAGSLYSILFSMFCAILPSTLRVSSRPPEIIFRVAIALRKNLQWVPFTDWIKFMAWYSKPHFYSLQKLPHLPKPFFKFTPKPNWSTDCLANMHCTVLSRCICLSCWCSCLGFSSSSLFNHSQDLASLSFQVNLRYCRQTTMINASLYSCKHLHMISFIYHVSSDQS